METDGPQARLQALLEREENRLCADCNQPDPAWASTNWGAFICTHCAGVHRSLGVEHSFVLSCTLDDWTDEQVDNMAANGNKAVNDLLEYSVPKTIEVPCETYTDRDTRDHYIQAKYVHQLFRKANGRSPRPPERIRRLGSNNALPRSMSCSHSAMVEYIGIVDVSLIAGRDLIVKDLTTSDPYCILTIGLQKRKTKPKYKTLNPEYNEHFSFSWDGTDQLVVEVFDKDELTKDDHMGKVTVDLEPLLQTQGAVLKGWHQVYHRKHKERLQGELLLKITFTQIK